MLLALVVYAGTHLSPIVSIDKEINADSVAPLVTFFQEAAKNHTDAVTLAIDSPGGSIAAGYDLIDAMRAAEAGGTKVTCDITEADSMAAVLVESACTTRKLHRKGHLMFHEGAYAFLVSTPGHRLTKGLLRELADSIAADDDKVAGMVAPRMHMTPAAYLAWVAGQDREVDAPTALARGFIDEID